MMTMNDALKKIENNRPKLISVADAAGELGVHPASVRRHLPLVRVGNRILVRVADVEAKIAEGRAVPSDLLALHGMAADVTYWLRRDYEKSGLPGHIVLMISSISGYLTEFAGQPLITTNDGTIGLAPDFIGWLKQNPPAGGGDDGEELRSFIRDYPQAQTEKA